MYICIWLDHIISFSMTIEMVADVDAPNGDNDDDALDAEEEDDTDGFQYQNTSFALR